MPHAASHTQPYPSSAARQFASQKKTALLPSIVPGCSSRATRGRSPRPSPAPSSATAPHPPPSHGVRKIAPVPCPVRGCLPQEAQGHSPGPSPAPSSAAALHPPVVRRCLRCHLHLADAVFATSRLAAGRADAPDLPNPAECMARCRSALPLEPPRRASSPSFPSSYVESPQFPTR